jgi:hypothetical protein
MSHLQRLKNWIAGIDGSTEIPMLIGDNPITVTPVRTADNYVIGVNVDNLGNQPFLSIDVFVAVISLLNLSPNRMATKGSAMNGTLGSNSLSVDSVEGHVAKVVYGIENGQWAFQRICPIVNILIAAGVCENVPGSLRLIG